MSNAIAIRSNTEVAEVIMSGNSVAINKRGKQGSLSALLAFGSKDHRQAVSQGITIRNIQNKTYRPFVNDLKASKLLSDEVMGLIGYKLGETGPIKGEVMEDFCNQALHALKAKLAKTNKSINDLKGEKRFYATMLQYICGDMDDIVVEA